ncbi:N-acyl homoserine lactonase family protein [Burkholderia plantarii]|uniref:N-acyl homoserine lactonase family protein n=1 Tax=Burkholderia plantarii TaxID=41899 RepID=UPI0018DD21DC|nr:N-acyl homoserine lactonase family protein [Burkholderia plantarii]MBI0328875.1 N-acyl homoserine lactonase family protein [Burkholderia plantarii]
MTAPTPPLYEVYALRIGSNAQRTARENFFFDACCGPPDASMPLDYFFWVVRDASRTVIVDTAFPISTGVRRERQMMRSVGDALAGLDIDPASVTDVIITHLHWDHAGNLDLFPNARVHVQGAELRFCTGTEMRHPALRKIYDREDVLQAVGILYDGRLVVHEGTSEFAPGIEMCLVGGHTPGSQVVRVATRRGHVVLAADAAHLWANVRGRLAFPILHDLAKVLDAFETIDALADGPDHVIPGHDPLVASVFPRFRDDPHTFCLHEDPLPGKAVRAAHKES